MWDKKEAMNDIWDKIDGLIMMKEFIEMNFSNVSREWSQRDQLHWYGKIVFVPSLYLHPNRTEPTPNIWNPNRTERNIKYLQKKIYEWDFR